MAGGQGEDGFPAELPVLSQMRKHIEAMNEQTAVSREDLPCHASPSSLTRGSGPTSGGLRGQSKHALPSSAPPCAAKGNK